MPPKTCRGGKKKIPGKSIGKDGLERIGGEPEGQELQAAYTERSLRNSEVRKEVDSFKIKFKITVVGWGSEQPELVASCSLQGGGSTLKNPFQPKLSCDSITDIDRVDFYWEKELD